MADTDKILDAIMAIIDRHVDNCNQITLESEIEKVLKSELESTRPVNVDLADINGSFNLQGLTELEVEKDSRGVFELTLSDDDGTNIKYLNDEEAKGLAEYLNYR